MDARWDDLGRDVNLGIPPAIAEARAGGDPPAVPKLCTEDADARLAENGRPCNSDVRLWVDPMEEERLRGLVSTA